MSDYSEPKPDFWIFSVANLQASLEYNRLKLGFALAWRNRDLP